VSQERDGARPLAAQQAERVFYTWSAQNAAVPLEIVSGAGARFQTADGARWFDLGSMTWNANLGHGHPRMRRALAAAAERGLLAYPT
jgi:taurine--2-oxoglutarate transaminase